MALIDRLKKRLKETASISVAEYMTLCLLDPKDGYYPTRDPLGSEGDFITAPEISQMFGEVLGLWCIQSWKDMGEPKQLHLIELGPGRGIMMSDILRTAKLEPAFFKALSVTLIEASAALEAVQAKTLANCNVPVSWVSDLKSVPSRPCLIIGNEFLDCLPIRQFIQKDRFAGAQGWHERMVMLDDQDRLSFGVATHPISATDQGLLPRAHREAKTEDLLEVCPAVAQIIDLLKDRFNTAPGRALFIDYGPEITEFGDSLQALKRHEKVGVFSNPGNTDLTARVDFQALREMAEAATLKALSPVSQRAFLSKLGIEMRAVALTRAQPEAKPKILRQLHRLMDEDEMGALFKAICFGSDDLETSLGF